MKKLDEMMSKEKEGEQQKVNSENVDPTISCDCCFELPIIQPITTRKEGEENEVGGEEHGLSDNQKKKLFLSDKLLIIIGLALTIPIVLLESLLPHSPLTGFMTLALASPTQLLLSLIHI